MAKERAETRHQLKMRTLKYDKEYAVHQRKLITMRRQAKSAGNFFVEPEAKVLFVIRIVGIIKLSPKPRKVLQLLRLRQLHNGVFLKMNKPIMNMLKLVQPYVTLGYPSLKSVREMVYKRGFGKVNKQRIPLMDTDIISQNLGKYGIHGHEDVIHELYTAGPQFKRVSNFLWPFKLSAPRGGFNCKRHGYNEMRGGDWGNRAEEINELIARMN
jgi:large subunit ribosomal protein L7e